MIFAVSKFILTFCGKSSSRLLCLPRINDFSIIKFQALTLSGPTFFRVSYGPGEGGLILKGLEEIQKITLLGLQWDHNWKSLEYIEIKNNKARLNLSNVKYCQMAFQLVHIGLTLFLTDLVTWYTMRGLIPPSPGRNREKNDKDANCQLSFLLEYCSEVPKYECYISYYFWGEFFYLHGLNRTYMIIRAPHLSGTPKYRIEHIWCLQSKERYLQ